MSVTPSAQELVQRARELIPTLEVRWERASAERRVAAETVAQMQAAGLFRVLQPKRWGGYEMDPQVFYRIQMALAEGCMSTAWIYGVIAVHNWQLALYDERAQRDVWGEDSSTLISSSYMPRGRLQRVAGGFRLSGRWGFSSGVDHCQWAFLGALVPGEGGSAAEFRTFLVPRCDLKVIDCWDTIGLRGTGSHDIEVEQAFVPDYRTHKASDGAAGTSPGSASIPASYIDCHLARSSCARYQARRSARCRARCITTAAGAPSVSRSMTVRAARRIPRRRRMPRRPRSPSMRCSWYWSATSNT